MVKDNNDVLGLRLIPYNHRLVAARKARGWSQRDLGLLTGLGRQMSAIETLRVIPSIEVQDEIATALDLDREYLFPISLLGAISAGVFDKRIATIGEPELRRVADKRVAGLLKVAITPEELSIDFHSLDNEYLKETMAEILLTLTDRERMILSLRFGLQDGRERDLLEVGREFNVTRERIRQIEAKALRRLRHRTRSHKLKDFLD